MGLFFRVLRSDLGGQTQPYVWVPELHKDGCRFHVHLAVGLFVPRRAIDEAWGHGSFTSSCWAIFRSGPGGWQRPSWPHGLERWLALGGADLDERVPQVARELGLDVELTRATAALSGGQGARLGLASLLLSRYDVLLLDEPTNHLDLPAIEQLESALRSYEGTLLLVTHDRRLLDAVDLNRRIVVSDGRVAD